MRVLRPSLVDAGLSLMAYRSSSPAMTIRWI
jgi:hypothetical protein